MKNIKHILLATIAIFLFQTAIADIIPVGMHQVHKKVTIANVAEYSDYTIFGTIIPVSGKNATHYIIDEDKQLTKGYKFNTFKIHAVKKEYLANKKIEDIDFRNNPNVLTANIDINPYGGYVEDSNPMNKQHISYSITGIEGNKLLLFKSKQTNWFNDGSPSTTQMYQSPSNSRKQEIAITNTAKEEEHTTAEETSIEATKEEQEKKGFFRSVGYFFKRLFTSKN